MTAADHILGIMKGSASDAEAARRIAEFTERGYNPKDGDGEFSRIGKDDMADLTDVRPAMPGMRCCAVIGDDYPQSGPLFCGKPAYVFCSHKRKKDAYYIMCEIHARRIGIKIEATP
jgi:hypothetical protein